MEQCGSWLFTLVGLAYGVCYICMCGLIKPLIFHYSDKNVFRLIFQRLQMCNRRESLQMTSWCCSWDGSKIDWGHMELVFIWGNVMRGSTVFMCFREGGRTYSSRSSWFGDQNRKRKTQIAVIKGSNCLRLEC